MLTVGSGGGGAGGPGSLTLQVAPEDLYQQAHDFDRAANIVQQAIMDNGMSLRVEPAGADVVSHAAAEWFTNSAFDSSTGALAQLDATVQSFRDAAQAMRAAAKGYGLTDTTNARHLGGTSA